MLSGIADKTVGRHLPPGMHAGEQIVTGAEMFLGSIGRQGDVEAGFEAMGKGLAWISRTLSMPLRLRLRAGSTTLVADCGRRDLLEILVRLRAVLDGDLHEQRHLSIVRGPLTFTDACYNYRWAGTVFEFTLGGGAGRPGIVHLAWHPRADYAPRIGAQQTLSDICRIGRVQHRSDPDQSGQDYQ